MYCVCFRSCRHRWVSMSTTSEQNQLPNSDYPGRFRPSNRIRSRAPAHNDLFENYFCAVLYFYSLSVRKTNPVALISCGIFKRLLCWYLANPLDASLHPAFVNITGVLNQILKKATFRVLPSPSKIFSSVDNNTQSPTQTCTSRVAIGCCGLSHRRKSQFIFVNSFSVTPLESFFREAHCALS